MGTNYYRVTEPCPHCGRSDRPEHIGKQSAGWPFHFHTDPDLPRSWKEWKERLKGALIDDGYGTDPMTPEQFEAMVEERKSARRDGYESFVDEDGWPFYEGEFS